MSRVFVTNEPYEKTEGGGMRSKFNLTPASEFGELTVLIPAGNSLISSVPTVRTMRDKLADFSDDDYLLPVGDPSAMMIAGAIAASVNNGRMKVLRWDRQEGRYLCIQIDVTGGAI